MAVEHLLEADRSLEACEKLGSFLQSSQCSERQGALGRASERTHRGCPADQGRDRLLNESGLGGNIARRATAESSQLLVVALELVSLRRHHVEQLDD